MRTTLILAVLSFASFAFSSQVDNFVLLDHEGKAHELYYYSDYDAVVLMVQGNACPIVRSLLPDYRSLRDSYPDQVKFLMINSNLQDDRASIHAEATEFGIDFPILQDDTQLIGESLSLSRTAEVLVIDTDGWDLAYRGPINDRVTFERQKAVAKRNYAGEALDAVLSGEELSIDTREAKGCLINFESTDGEAISYADDIVPILEHNCVKCHQENGIAPWAMSSYEMVRGFSPMIAEVIRTKRMPPWHADPHVGSWSNDRSLTTEDKRTLLHWIATGSPRGTGDDPLKEKTLVGSTWDLGEPDLIVDVPEFEVPATGVVEYQNWSIPMNLEEGAWIRSADVLPGDTNVVHHVLMGSTDGPPRRNRRTGVTENFIGGYAPGVEGAVFPEGTGIYIKPGSNLEIQVHYTPYGKKTIDRTKIGLYFHEEIPDNFLRQGVVVNLNISIPPNTKAHEEHAYYQFDNDAHLYQVLPHSHYRGSSSTFTLVYPDSTSELLLSVPKYDFNWQLGYAFETPKAVPAGSKLVHTTVYDNSNLNPGNPDPGRTVTWGLQSWDEMLYGAFVYTLDEESSSKPILDRRRGRLKQLMGYLDNDLNGLIEKNELSSRAVADLGPAFEQSDINGDSGLDLDEYQQFIVNMSRERAKARAKARAQSSQETPTEGE